MTPRPADDPGHWANIAESTFAGGMLALYAVYRYLGRWPFRLCLYPVVSYYWLTRKQARAASLQYLRRHHAFHRLPGPPPGALQSFRHFLIFAEVILDKMLAYTGRYRVEHMQVNGHQPLLDLMAAGRGAVVVTSHTGCVELSQAMAEHRRGIKLTILVHTRHAERFNRLMTRLGGERTVEFLQVTEFSAATALMLAERVQRGELLAIAGDRVPVGGGRVCTADFLGHAAHFPAGPTILAAVLKCPLFFMGCVRRGASYALEFSQIAEQVALPHKQRTQALDHYARLYATQLEALLHDAPYDWFNFFPFWDQGGSPQQAGTQGQSAHGYTTHGTTTH